MRPPEQVSALAARLAREDALPAYIYDLAGLDAHAARIRAALPAGVQFYYAVKANPDAAVLRTVARHADGLEVSSGGELAHATAVAPEKPLAFGGPGKTAAELAAAVRAGALLHVESPQELRLLASVARDLGGQARGAAAGVLLRANLDVALPDPFPANLPPAPGVTVDRITHGNTFGFMLMERAGSGWTYKAYTKTGTLMATCALASNRLNCDKAGFLAG